MKADVPTPDVVGALERVLAEREKRDAWDDKSLHASDLGYAIDDPREAKCPRQLWLRLNGAAKKASTSGDLLMFAQGHNLEAWVFEQVDEALFAQGWVVEAKNLDVSDKLPDDFTGELDRLLVNEWGVRIVVDVKTVRLKALDFIRQYGPKQKDVLQVRTYISAVKADAGLLVYVDRNGSNFAEQFYVSRNDDVIEPAMERVRAIRDSDEPPPVLGPVVSFRKNKGPDAVYVEAPWQCRYCAYHRVSCDGALGGEDSLGLVGHVLDGGVGLKLKDDVELDESLADLIDRAVLEAYGVDDAENAA